MRVQTSSRTSRTRAFCAALSPVSCSSRSSPAESVRRAAWYGSRYPKLPVMR